VAKVSAALARTRHYGLYHATAHGETSWAEFARLAASILGVPDERVTGVPTSALPLKAPRPRRAILDNRMLRERGLDLFSPWQDSLRAFIAEEARVG
jgi:dTDP-4-dehydrorhamnose reductase